MKCIISKIFFSFLFTYSLLAQSDYRIIASDFNSLIIEYTPLYLDTSLVKYDDEFRNANFLSGKIENYNDWGMPIIQTRIFPVGVPSEFGNSIEVLNYTYKELIGQLLPVPSPYSDSGLSSFKYEKSNHYNNFQPLNEVVTFGEYALAGNIKTQFVKVYPVNFDPALNKIKILTQIRFKVNFASGELISNIPSDDLIASAIINNNVARYWTESNRTIKKPTVTNSVLATGKWIRFEAPEEGIYQITRSNLSTFGIDPSNVDPRTIKIYNNGGKVLPENILQPRPNDLVENSIIVVGEEDGSFDEGDYILFYGRGTIFWDYASDSTTVTRNYHPYSTQNYFWITSGGAPGKRMAKKSSLNQTADFIQNTTSAYISFEEDKINIGKTGRQFYGDDFSQSISSRTYMNMLDARINSEPVNYFFRFAVGSPDGLTLTVSENGNQVFSQVLDGYGGAQYTVGRLHQKSFTFNSPITNNRSALTFRVTPLSVTSIGYLDYFTIEYLRGLNTLNDNLLFFSNAQSGIIEYQLSGFTSSNIKVFDVTDSYNVVEMNNFSLLSGSECRFKVSESSSSRSKYYAVGSNNFKSPMNPVEISNSNLRGETTGAKFIIITHKNFLEAANQLKNFRQNEAEPKISTLVVDVDQIYNEFSCGIVDISAIRDYIKYANDNWQIPPKYICLFGKGTYDYKNIEGFGDNFIPTWQTEQSLIFIGGGDSYTTDDFFVRVVGADNVIDVAIGRIPSVSVEEALNYVNKVINYEKNSENGSWRNLITLVSDDGLTSTGNDYEWHTRPSENLANIVFPKSFDFNKIYLASYPTILTSGGRRKPEVNTAILNAINQGTLFINYVGHGNPEVWAHEFVFEKSVTIPQIRNKEFFFLCAATCDFGYYDVPNYQSSTEELVLLDNTGAIAAFSSSRLVYGNLNEALNYALVRAMFDSESDTLNLPIPIGEAIRLTKFTNSQVNDQKYHLFGDPTIRLKIPKYLAVIDSINGQQLNSNIQIKALSKVTINGRAADTDSVTLSSFNGEGILTVYDSERRVLLEQISRPNSPFYMTLQNSIIFRGRVSITNGYFAAEFVVPKDISYENLNGKINFYFFNPESDGVGFTSRILVGGTDSTAVNDGNGPEINIFFDDENYQSAYLVDESPTLIVKLEDETGLNTTGTGVGHKLEGILNEQVNDPLDFTNFFTGDLDSGGKSGKINYKFLNLENGDYQIQVKAWDVFNNFSTEKSFFTVVNNNELVVRDIFNYPNPFGSNTTFTFQHNLSNPIDVRIKVYTISGRLIKEIEKASVLDRYVTVNWDGRDADGNELANGTYLYKLIVKSTDGLFNNSYLGKMAVIR